MALSAAVKDQISAWYRALQQHIPGFIPRLAQRQMIAHVANTLSGASGRHLAIEAPTGVGKTLSYLIPGIAISRAESKPLVVSTANVALQDQIYCKDLPLLKRCIPDLRFTAAFGRGRYVCPRNLAALCANAGGQEDLPLFLFDEPIPVGEAECQSCLDLSVALKNQQWDGLRDHYQQTLSDELWLKLSTDRANCLGRNCHYIRECPFFLARKEIENADVVVTNHALVMAALESESVLPPASELLLIMDEGHHLPEVARDALEVDAEITPLIVGGQLDALLRLIQLCLTQYSPKNPPGLSQSERLNHHCAEMRDLLRSVESIIQTVFIQEIANNDESPQILRFPLGQLPEEMQENAQRLSKLSDGLRNLTEYYLNELSEKSGKFDVVRLQKNILALSRALGYWETMSKLWRLAALAEVSHAPLSKWLTREQHNGVWHTHFHCAGIRVSEQLEKQLWRKVPHVILTSATLRSLNSFSRLQELSGLREKAGDHFIALDSPFDHISQGRLIIPRMHYEPQLQHESEHLAEMASFFRAELDKKIHKGMLILFSSQRAMQTFLGYLTDLRLMLLVQGDQPRYRLVEEHCRRIQAGKSSVLIGLQSFAEGLDLKGELLTQVHIHKIAFPPIDSPVILTEGEWLTSLKRYPFEVQSLPSASFTLIQQVGRLIRSHHCHGEIVIYDRRLLTKYYGQRLLNALPVFPIEQPDVPMIKIPPRLSTKAQPVTENKTKKRSYRKKKP